MYLKLPQKAFSLVELMVVISIIGIISAVSLSSLTAIQKNNRDAQRQADLRVIQGALQQFYANENHYPDSVVLSAGAPIDNCTGTTGCTTILRTYLSKSPADPTAGTATPYCYAPLKTAGSTATCTTGQCYYYQLNAKLENAVGSTTYSCNNNATYNFQVTPL